MIKINKIIHLIFLNFLLTNVIYFSFSQYSFASVDRVRNTSGNNCETLDDSSCYAGVCDSDISASEQEPCYVSNYNTQAQSCDVGNVWFNPFGNDINWDLGNPHCISYVTLVAIGLASAFMACDIACPNPTPIGQQLSEIKQNLKPSGQSGFGMVSGKVVKHTGDVPYNGVFKSFYESYTKYKSAINKVGQKTLDFGSRAGSSASNMIAGAGVIDPVNIYKIINYGSRCGNILIPTDAANCCMASVSCGLAYSAAIAVLGGIFETSKKAFEEIRICGEPAKIWKISDKKYKQEQHDYFKCLNIRYKNSTTSLNIDISQIDCSLNIANKNLCDLRGSLGIINCNLITYDDLSSEENKKQNKHYRQYLFKGFEYEDNGDGACDNPSGQEWDKELGYSNGKQRYYFSGPGREPNFACQRYIAKGLNDNEGKKAFECCKKRAKDTICLEHKSGDKHKFCSASGSECWIASNPVNPIVRYSIFNSLENPNYLCAESFSVCPFNYPVAGGTEIAEIHSKSGVLSNFCQYRRHCIKIPPTYEIKSSDIGANFFSDACTNRKGDSQFYNSLSSINSPIPLKSRNFSAPIFQCLKESLENNFLQIYGKNICADSGDYIKGNKCINPLTKAQSPFLHRKGDQIGDNLLSKIQKNFGYFIKLALIFAIIMFGYNILLATPEMFIQKKVILMFVIKIGLVSFFALDRGWHTAFMNSLLKISTDLSEMTFMPSPKNDGCNFPKYNYESLRKLKSSDDMATGLNNFNTEYGTKPNGYPPESYYLRIWDTLDCKLARALGYGPDINSENFTKMILAGFISGPLGITMLFASFAYGFMLISIILRSIHIATMSIVGVILLLFVSPITITCIMFERTKGIFENWYKQMFGFILQPMILFAYLGLLLTVFDNIFIGDAKFKDITPSTSNPAFLSTKLNEIDCADTATSKPSNNSIYCIFGYPSFKKYTGLEIFGIALPVLTNLNRDKINTIIRAAIILFIFYQFLDKITFVARKLVGGADLKPDDIPDIKSKVQKFTKGVQKRALNATQKFATKHSKPIAGALSKAYGSVSSKFKKAPTKDKPSADSASFSSDSNSPPTP